MTGGIERFLGTEMTKGIERFVHYHKAIVDGQKIELNSGLTEVLESSALAHERELRISQVLFNFYFIH